MPKAAYRDGRGKHHMRIIITALLAATALPAAAATYLPFGPQQNVAISTVTGGGWSLCYAAGMGTAFGNDASALSNCTGDRIMLAGRQTGSANLLVLAQTTTVAALTNTGAANNGVTTTSDGSEWYYADRWSWGFAELGGSVSKDECDTNSGAARICIHTFDFVGGYRIGNISTNDSQAYEKLVFTNSAVPEPATWAMLIVGFGLVGTAARRRALAAA